MEENYGLWPAVKRDAIIRGRVNEWMSRLKPDLAKERFLISEIRNKKAHSEVILRVAERTGAEGHKFLLIVPFPETIKNEDSIAPSKMFRYNEKVRQWQRQSFPSKADEQRKISRMRPPAEEPLKALTYWIERWPSLGYLVAALLIIIGLTAIFTPIRDTVNGLRSYFWKEVGLAKEAQGWSYPDPVDGRKIEVSDVRYTVATIRPSDESYHKLFERAQAWWAFQHHKPTVVYVNPANPSEAVLVNGIPPQSTGWFLLQSAILLIGLRFLMDLRRGRLNGFVYAMIAGAHLISFGIYAAIAWLWSHLVFVPMPGWPGLLWLGVLIVFELVPGLWTWISSYEWFTWSLQQFIIIALLPVCTALLGLGLPVILGIVIAGLLLAVLFSVFRPNRIPQSIIRLFWMPFYIAGVLAAFRALCLLVYMLFPGVPYHVPWKFLSDITTVARLDLAIGAAGIIVALISTFLDTFWRFLQARQVTNLATSRAASAAPGIAEFRGRAESIDSSSEPVLSFVMPGEAKIEPFYLVDSSGKILIDPRGAKFRIGRASSYGGRLNEILLKKRMTRPLLNQPLTTQLLPGDEFYVIGNVMQNPEALPGAVGPDALVLRPLVEPGITNTFLSIMLGNTQIPAARDIQHVFFLSDGTEQEARRHIMKGLWDIWGKAVIVILLCIILISLQEPRARGGSETWTLGEMLHGQFAENEKVTYIVDTLLIAGDEWPPQGWLRKTIYFSKLLEIKDKIEKTDATNFFWNYVRTPRYHENSKDIARLYEKSSESAIRRYAVWALGKVKAPPDLARPLLLQAMKDPDPGVKVNAAQSLAEIMPEAHPEVVKAFLEAASGHDDGIARIALFSLRETRNLPAEEVTPVVAPLLRHKEKYVRHEAANVLAHLKEGALPALDLLRIALHDPEYIVQNSAAVAIGNIGSAAAPAVPDLISAMRSKEHGTRMFVAEALGKIGPAAVEAIPELTAALDDKDQHTRKAAESAIKRIRKNLDR